MGDMPGCNKSDFDCNRYNRCSYCKSAFEEAERRAYQGDPLPSGGTMNSTVFRSKPQRNDPSVSNDYFNSGKQDGSNHGHAKYRNNPDGTTDYLFVRDVEGNEYDL